MSRVDQILAGAAPGDAVTESALQIRRRLKGVGGRIYAQHLDARVAAEVRPLDRFRPASERDPNDVLIYHATIGGNGLAELVGGGPEHLVLVYHNITPSHFFAEIDQPFAHLLEAGRRDLTSLLPRADRVVADSQFNARELIALGREEVIVIPPPMNLDRLSTKRQTNRMTRELDQRARGPVVLFVGQLLPHKRVDLLVAAHHLLVTNDEPDALLVISGPQRNPTYRDALREFVDAMNLHRNVWITGELSDRDLSTLFARADLFVTASEHEGFCVPLIEAFSFDIPVVARDYGAIKETAGQAALVLPADSGARDLAEAMLRVLHDPSLRRELVRRERLRRRTFSPDESSQRMGDIVRELLTQGE